MVRTVLGLEAVTLAGARSSHGVVVATPDNATLVVELRWRTSAELDLDRSVLVVTVDGTAIASVRLRAGTSLVASTSVARGGFHRVEVRARLFAIDEVCLALDAERAWLVLERDSAVVAPSAGVTLASILDAWRAEPDRPLTVAFASASEPATPADIATYLEADASARMWSRKLMEVSAAERPALRVAWGQPVLDDAVATIAATSDGLLVNAVDSAGAQAALAALRDGRFVDACRVLPCRVAGRGAAVETAETPVAPGFTLADRGFSAGVVLRGAGTHHQSWRWQRPAEVTPQAWPTLHLLFTLPTMLQQAGARSLVTVEVNQRPIGTFDLGGAVDGQVHVAARVPASVWTATTWEFDVAVLLAGFDGEACTSTPDTATWVVIEPESGLTVPAREARYGGLSDIAVALGEGHRPPVVLDVALPRRALPALAAAAAPFALAAPAVDWVFADRCTAPVCLTITSADSDRRERLALVTAAGVALPATGDALAIRRQPCADGTCDLVDVLLPRGDARWWPAPDYAQLIGGGAVAAADRWYPVQIAARPTTTIVRSAVTPPSWPRAATSHELRRRLVRDLIWAAVVIVVLGGLGYGFRRSSRMRRRRAAP